MNIIHDDEIFLAHGLLQTSSLLPMIKYLAKRRCPKCSYSFIVMLLEHGRRMHTVNGFCGHCDHSSIWQLLRGKASMDSRSTVRITARNSISLDRPMTSQLTDSADTSSITYKRRGTARMTQPDNVLWMSAVLQ